MPHKKLLSSLLMIALLLAGWAMPDGGASVASASSPEEALAKIEPLVLEELEAKGQTEFFVWMVEKADLSPAYQLKTKLEKGRFVFNTLVETAERTQKDLRRYLDAQGVDYEPFYIANKILVRGGNRTLLLNVAARPDVERITANHQYQLEEPDVTLNPPPKVTAIEPNISFIFADQVWAMGITGTGIVLAGNDTGLDEAHPTIARHYRGCLNPPTCSSWDHNYNWWDATNTYPTDPYDGHGHGTHTTGTMVGDDGGANQIGVAPGAQTIHCKNMTNGGSGTDDTFTTCFQWDLAPWDLNHQNPRPDLAPDAINNSWGYWGGGQNQFRDEILALHAAGILVEVSAGNEGTACATLRSPGDYQEVLTTGSVDHLGQTFPGIITVAATWSTSRGPSDLDGNYFPDIMAPGNQIRSALPGNQYAYWGGTSMAGPHATALVGLMWSACPSLRGRVEDTIQIIRNTAGPLTGQYGSNCGGNYTVGPNNDWGMGTIHALAAVQAAIANCVGVGYLHGHVRDAVTTNPLESATVTAEWENGGQWQDDTDATGYYTLTLPNGAYTVTATLFGYAPTTVTGVQVITDLVTTQDLYLTPLPQYVISGTVTEQGTGIPLLARVEAVDTPLAPVWTNPATGFYSISVPEGTYTFRVTAAQHQPAERVVVADHDQTQNFSLATLPCILLVDDDNNVPDTRPYFTAALDALGYDYDIFDVGGGGGNGPDLAGLQGYSIVIWFSGDKYGGSAGPSGTDETNLAAYLDGGGRLFLSSQDYLYDFGLTGFGQTYLGIGSYTNDSGDATTKHGVAGDPIGDGLGPYPLSYPSGFSDYGDIVNAGAGASVAFRSSAAGGNNLDVDKASGAWKTVFFGTDWVPIANANAANGRTVLQRIINWFGNCQPPNGWLVGQVTDVVSGAPLAGAQVLVQPSARGSIQALTDPNGRYTMTLPADTYDVTASMTGYISQTATGVEVQVGVTTTQDFSLEPVPGIVVEPPTLEAALYADQVETQTLWITNTGAASLSFWLHEMSRTLAVDAGPRSRPRTEPVVDAAVWDQVRAEGQARAIIYLRDLADLRPAYTMRDRAERGRFVYEQLQATAERSGGELRTLLAAAGAEPRPLLTTNAIAAMVDAPLLEAIAARPEVAHVGPDAVLFVPSLTQGEQETAVQTVEWNIAKIRADEAWDTFGITGQGVTVGNIGTGVMYDHAALVAQYRGNLGGGNFDHNYNWFDLVGGQPAPYDDNGHSTFGIGIVVGDDGGVNQIGVAPGAKWIAVKACSGSGSCSLSDLHAGFQWMLAPTDLSGNNPDPARRPHIGLNMWGIGGCNTEFQPDLLAWQAAGILPVFPPGGSGPGCMTVGSPAALPEAVSAGATDSNDVIAPFSSRGPSPCDGQIKPEVAAPGVNIRSSYGDGGYQVWSGTSMSAAHLAGIAALVLSADPTLSTGDLETIVEETALCIEDLSCGGTPCPDGANNVYGWGRIDAFEAVSLTLGGLEYDLPWLSETPTSGTLDPGAGMAIAVTFDTSGLEPGVYLGLLDVASDDPATPHIGIPVTLTVLPPCQPVEIVTVTADVSGCIVAFAAELSGTQPYSYEWSWGAFGSSAEPAPVVDFGVSGSYPYTLTVSNCGGTYTDALTGTVTVACEAECKPVGILTVTHEISGCAVAFGVNLTGTLPFTFAWDFGAFGSSAEPAPVVDFGVSGSYPYTLTVWNCGGLYADTVSGTVAVECEPVEHLYIYLPLILREE